MCYIFFERVPLHTLSYILLFRFNGKNIIQIFDIPGVHSNTSFANLKLSECIFAL